VEAPDYPVVHEQQRLVNKSPRRMVYTLFPIGHSTPQMPVINQDGVGPSLERPSEAIEGCHDLGAGKPKLNSPRGPDMPLVKLNTTEAHLQRLQNYAAGTVTMKTIKHFSPPPVISMTNLPAYKKGTSRSASWACKNLNNPS
jgi:hypothetical protein